jgi:hypothetical protein
MAMMYFHVDPEASGENGHNGIRERTKSGIIVHYLHYVACFWCGDALVWVFPCYVLREEAVRAVEAAGLTGAFFSESDMEVSKELQYDDIMKGVELPKFLWMHVTGTAAQDDFGMFGYGNLIISQRARDLLTPFGLAAATFEEFEAFRIQYERKKQEREKQGGPCCGS